LLYDNGKREESSPSPLPRSSVTTLPEGDLPAEAFVDRLCVLTLADRSELDDLAIGSDLQRVTDRADRFEIEWVLGFIQRIDVDQPRFFGLCFGSDLGNGSQTAVPGQFGCRQRV